MNKLYTNLQYTFKISSMLIQYNLIPSFVPYIISFVFKILIFISYPLFKNIRKMSEGERLQHALKRLGPVHVKFGQILSTSPDLIGKDIAMSLKSLQDKVEPFSFEEVKKTIEKETGKSLDEIYDYFNEQPKSAASIAQVHEATLKDTKEKVAVKVIRPDVRKKYNRDIEFLYFVVDIATKFLPNAAVRLKLKEVIDVLKQTMKTEVNLRLEAAASSEMRDNFAGSDLVYIPKIYWDYTSQDVLTMEWIKGISIYDKDKLLKHNISPHKVASNLALMFFIQAYQNGYFHADLHPGNILVLENGQIALLDFGIMGRLAEKDRIALAEILHGFLSRDYLQIAKVHKRAGYVSSDIDINFFAQHIRSVGEQIVNKPLKDISVGKLLSQLFKITDEFCMQTQTQLLLIQKTTVTIENIGKILDPNINMWKMAEPWIENWALKNITLDAKIARYIKNKYEELYAKTLYK